MCQFTTSLLVLGLSLAVLSPTLGEETKREERQFYYPVYSKDLHQAQYSPYFEEPSAAATSSASQRLFFNLLPGLGAQGAGLSGLNSPLAGILGQGQGRPIATCPVCKDCTPNPVCPPVPLPALLTSTVAAGCTSLATIGPCSSASYAPSGTTRVTWPGVAGGGAAPNLAVLTIVAQAPNTRVRVICPFLPAAVTARTQNAALVENVAQIINDFTQITFSATAPNGVGTDTTTVCSWTSLP